MLLILASVTCGRAALWDRDFVLWEVADVCLVRLGQSPLFGKERKERWKGRGLANEADCLGIQGFARGKSGVRWLLAVAPISTLSCWEQTCTDDGDAMFTVQALMMFRLRRQQTSVLFQRLGANATAIPIQCEQAIFINF